MAFPMNSAAVPPGLAGYLATQQHLTGQDQARMQQAVGLMGLLQAARQQEQAAQMQPLQLAKLRGEIEQQQLDRGLLAQFMASRGGPSAVGAPAVARDVSGQPIAGGMSIPGAGGGVAPSGGALRLPNDVAIGFLHPRTAGLAKAEAENFKPTDKMREAIALGYRPGTPEFNAYIGTIATQGGIWNRGPAGAVSLAPGFAAGQGQVKEQEERARAGFDLVEVPMSDGSKRTMSRAEALRLMGPQAPTPAPAPSARPLGFPVVTPEQQAARDAEAQRVTANERNVAAGQPSALPATASVIGLTPTPAARVRDETTARERAEGGVKLEQAIVDAGRVARTNLTQLQILAPNLEKLPTGPLFPILAGGAAYFKQFGIDVPGLGKTLGTAQATDAILRQLALKVRDPSSGGGMPGALSDADRNFLVNSIPSLGKVPDGNRELMRIMMTLEQRKVDEAAIVTRMQADNKSSPEIRDALSQFANSRPMFAR